MSHTDKTRSLLHQPPVSSEEGGPGGVQEVHSTGEEEAEGVAPTGRADARPNPSPVPERVLRPGLLLLDHLCYSMR